MKVILPSVVIAVTLVAFAAGAEAQQSSKVSRAALLHAGSSSGIVRQATHAVSRSIKPRPQRMHRQRFLPFGTVGAGTHQIIIIQQFNYTEPALDSEEPTKNRIYVPPRWVDSGHGVEILAPGHWIDPAHAPNH